MFQVRDCDFNALMAYDEKCFVRPASAWRREFMFRWRKVPGGRAVMAVSGQGDFVGYGCRNLAVSHGKMHVIGPLYADTVDVARALLHELTRDIVGQTVVTYMMLVAFLQRFL